MPAQKIVFQTGKFFHSCFFPRMQSWKIEFQTGDFFNSCFFPRMQSWKIEFQTVNFFYSCSLPRMPAWKIEFQTVNFFYSCFYPRMPTWKIEFQTVNFFYSCFFPACRLGKPSKDSSGRRHWLVRASCLRNLGWGSLIDAWGIALKGRNPMQSNLRKLHKCMGKGPERPEPHAILASEDSKMHGERPWKARTPCIFFSYS